MADFLGKTGRSTDLFYFALKFCLGLSAVIVPCPAMPMVFSLPSLGVESRDTKLNILDLGALEGNLVPLGQDTRLIWGSLTGFATEPYDSSDGRAPADRSLVGFGEASLIVSNNWATIRYLGEGPAGAGLLGAELVEAVRESLGAPNDIVPVTTAAHTIKKMMDEYFSPLLKSLPSGEDILKTIHVNGAYFSPTYNPRDVGRLDYDNAFIVGGQTLHIYPSSCFHKPDPTSCKKPFLTTGHDATVIGHELGHVIYNQVQGLKNPRGYQWFAVNEGYADYFSASFFETPEIGNAWQMGRTTAPYLRRLTDFPGTRDPDILSSFHEYSRVWSGLLWRIRSQLKSQRKDLVFEFDRTVLLSQFHLGEGGGNRLGDAARALIKASYELGHEEWDPIIRNALKESEVAIEVEDLAAMDGLKKKEPHFGCTPQGSSDAQTTGASEPSLPGDFGFACLVAFPFFLRLRMRTLLRRSWTGFGLFLLAAVFLFSNLTSSCIRKKEPERVSKVLDLGAERVSYDCELRSLAGVSGEAKRESIVIAAVVGNPQRFVLFEESREDPLEAVQVLVDSEAKRVDRILQLDGLPLKGTLGGDAIDEVQAARLAKMSLAMMVFQQAPQAAVAKIRSASVEVSTTKRPAADPKSVMFVAMGERMVEASYEQVLSATTAEKPERLLRVLPTSLTLNQEQICLKKQ